MRFAALDWLVVGAYFAVLLGIAAWVARRRQQTAADYFLAGRHVGWFAIGASLFASNIGSEHVVGLAGSGAGPGAADGADLRRPAVRGRPARADLDDGRSRPVGRHRAAGGGGAGLFQLIPGAAAHRGYRG